LSDTDYVFEIVERKIFWVVEVEAISQRDFFSKGLVLAVLSHKIVHWAD
jgi:hypothetical protein